LYYIVLYVCSAKLKFKVDIVMKKVKKIKRIVLKGYHKALKMREKDNLSIILKNKGMSYSTYFYRFTRDGFKPWEYEGIITVIKQFNPEYDEKLSLFWDSLTQKKPFFEYMESKGMSRGTVNTRFRDFNFKEFELIGIKQIMEDFDNERTI